MTSRNGIIGIIVVAVIIIAAFFVFDEANEGPLEKAGEDIDDAIEDTADELDG